MRGDSGEHIIRFGVFELDVRAGELRRSGMRLPIQGRPLRLLAMLVRSPGRLFTVEEIRMELWPAGTFVDFDHGIRNAVARLRAVLGDTAATPRFIETLPRRGYRFIGSVEVPQDLPAVAPIAVERRRSVPHTRWIVVGCAFVLLGITGLVYRGARSRPEPFQITSLAVLPLENKSGDSAQAYFADGITDELTALIARSNVVKVISRASVMQYKGVHKPLAEVARELGVDGIVEGTLARSGDRVRMTVQLIYAATGRLLWAERYERDTRDILFLEDDIAAAVAEQIRGKPSPPAPRPAANAVDESAHEAYLRGRYLWGKRTRPAVEEAVKYYADAVRRAPAYVPAYSGLADAYIVLGSWAMEAIPPEEAREKAKAAARKALELDSRSAEAHTSLATVRAIYEWDWRGALSEYQQAIGLNPNYPNAHRWYGACLCQVGRFNDCLAETARAHALDPNNLIASVDVGHRLYWARRYPEAIEPIRKTLQFDSDFVLGHRMLGEVYLANHMYKEAVTELRRSTELSNGDPSDLAALAHAYAVSGQPAQARALLHRLERIATQRFVSSYGTALIYVGLGEKERALACLQREFERRSTWMAHLHVDPRLDPLRSDARFADLVRRVGLTGTVLDDTLRVP